MVNGRKVIAVCVAKIGDGGSYEYVEQLHACFAPKGYAMMVYNTCSDFYWDRDSEQGEKQVFDLIDYDITDAVVIVVSSFFRKDLVEKIVRCAHENGKPAFCIDGDCEGGIMVMPDYKECFRKIVKHVVEHHKVKDVGYISGVKGNPFSDEREAIYREVLEENGIPYDEKKVWYGGFWANPTVEAIRGMVAEKKVPRALICANDAMAIAASTELRENRYRVPEDVIVTGFDGLLEGRYISPSITTCDDNYKKTAEGVTHLLEQSFQGESIDTYHKVGFDVRMGQSCGCVRQGVIFYGGSEMITLNDTLNHYRVMDRMFHEIAMEIFSCESVEHMRTVVKEIMPPNITWLVNGSFLDWEKQAVSGMGQSAFEDEMVVLYDYSDRFLEQEETCLDKWNRKEGGVIPNWEKLLEADRPLVFNSLCFRNSAIGYVCTYLPLDKSEYLSISQYAIGLGNALGGFRNARYETYLNRKLEEIHT